MATIIYFDTDISSQEKIKNLLSNQYSLFVTTTIEETILLHNSQLPELLIINDTTYAQCNSKDINNLKHKTAQTPKIIINQISSTTDESTIAIFKEHFDVTELKKTVDQIIKTRLLNASNPKEDYTELSCNTSRYLNAFEHLRLALLYINSEGEIVDYNQQFIDFFGILVDDSPFSKSFQKQISIDITRFIKKALNGETNYISEAERVTDDDSIYYYINIHPIHAENNKYDVLVTFEDITEKKRSEEILQYNEENLRVIFNTMDDAIIAVDAFKQIDRMNSVAERLTGWDGAEGDNIEDIFKIYRPSNLFEECKPVDHVFKTGFPFYSSEPYLFRSKNNETYYISFVIAPVKNSNGMVTDVVIKIKDITGEFRIREIMERTQFAIENAPDSIYFLNPDGHFLWANNKTLETFGIPLNELSQHNIFEFCKYNMKDDWEEQCEKADKWGISTIETEHLNTLGKFFPVETLQYPINTKNYHYYCVFAHDITERKLQEKEKNRNQANLIAQVENIEGAIWSINVNFELMIFNQTFYNYCLENFNQPISNGLSLLEIFTEPMRSLWLTRFSQALAGTKFTSLDHQNDKYFETAFNPIKEGREVIGVSCVMSDITVQKEYEITLKEAKEKAEVANLAKSSFLTNMGHELKTPINAIMGFSEIISHESNNAQISHYAENIQTSSKTLLELINSILDLSTLETGQLSLQESCCNIAFVLEEIRNIFEFKAQEKKLDFRINISNNFPASILIDELRLKQIILNLTSNAIKFTSKGFVRIIINHNFIDSQTISLQIIVEDTGAGIPNEQKQFIFEAFRQIEETENRKFEGTGLGLTLTQRLIALMKGSLNVESHEGIGSKFIVYFPEIKIFDEKQIIQNTPQLRIITRNQETESSNTTISPNQVKELLDVVKTKIYPLWKEVERTQPHKKVTHFADTIIDIGRMHQISILTNYGIQLKNANTTFNIQEIKRLITNFESIISQIERLK